jgi:hypothetical protein
MPAPLVLPVEPLPASLVTNLVARATSLTALLALSATSRAEPPASKATAAGALKVALVPTTPSAKGALLLLPASVAALHRQGGCALKPATGQAEAGEHARHAPGGLAWVPAGQLAAA